MIQMEKVLIGQKYLQQIILNDPRIWKIYIFMNLFESIKFDIVGKGKEQKDSKSDKRMYFTKEHPANELSFFGERDKDVVPMIPNDMRFPDLEVLQLGNSYVTAPVKEMREKYSYLSLILIFPFRSMNDLKDDQSGLYRPRFITLRDANQLKYEELMILQNIQDQMQCEN